MRDHYEGGIAIDASGGLPDGTTFTGVEGLKAAILKKPDIFITTVTQRLMTYGLGRGLEYYDAPAVRAIVKNAHEQNYQFSSLLVGVINSVPFQNEEGRNDPF